MRRRTIAAIAATSVLSLAALGGAAEAAPGVVVQGVNMRSGPGVDYPLVTPLDPGTPVEIFGCLQGWTWCDVAAVGTRGWVAGVTLQVLYQDQPEPLYGYGAEIGLPFIGFDFGDYWGRYYRGRPWYSPVDRWHGGGAGFERHDFDHRGFEGRGPEVRGPERGFVGPGPGGHFEDRGGFHGGPGPQGGPRPGPEMHGGPGPGGHPGGPGGGPGGRPGGGPGGHPAEGGRPGGGGHGPEGHGGDHPPH